MLSPKWQVTMTEKLPWVPPWTPILEDKPVWALLTVRALAGFWTMLGFVLWCCVRRPKATSAGGAGLEEKKDQ
jgi:hypothetical protein